MTTRERRTFDHIHHPLTQLSTKGKRFRNEFLSVSRMEKFDQCPLSFYYRYIERIREQPSIPALFGNVCHWALEDLYDWVSLEQFSGPIPKQRMHELFAKWFEESRINVLPGAEGMQLFDDGRDVMMKFATQNPDVDHRKIISTEMEFMLPLGDGLWDVKGYIDRVDRTNPAGDYRDDEVTVRDYKSSRLLFSRDELESNLQGTVYIAACMRAFPWAKKIHFGFDMLRHGTTQWITRDRSQLRSARDYLLILGRQSEDESLGYPPRLNKYCGWCSYSDRCPKYQSALKTDDMEALLQVAVPEAIEQISKDREDAFCIFKLAKTRKESLEKLLKAQFEKEGDVETNGMIYRWNKTRNGISYDTDKTIDVLVDKGIGTDGELRKKLLIVEPARLTRLLTALGKKPGANKAELKMLKFELEALGKTKYITRLDARKDKEK